jgi:hypothetical protein
MRVFEEVPDKMPETTLALAATHWYCTCGRGLIPPAPRLQ